MEWYSVISHFFCHLLCEIFFLIYFKLDGSFEIIDEIKDFVYCTAAKYSNRLTTSLGTHLVTLFLASDKRDDSEINRIITGLACSTNETIIDRFIYLYILCSVGTLRFFLYLNNISVICS